jgi:hypothetical protein
LLQANAMPGLAMMAVTSASPIIENEKRFINILLSSPRQLCGFARLSQNDECLMASGGMHFPGATSQLSLKRFYLRDEAVFRARPWISASASCCGIGRPSR